MQVLDGFGCGPLGDCFHLTTLPVSTSVCLFGFIEFVFAYYILFVLLPVPDLDFWQTIWYLFSSDCFNKHLNHVYILSACASEPDMKFLSTLSPRLDHVKSKCQNFKVIIKSKCIKIRNQSQPSHHFMSTYIIGMTEITKIIQFLLHQTKVWDKKYRKHF